jgi:hypothetical protein
VTARNGQHTPSLAGLNPGLGVTTTLTPRKVLVFPTSPDDPVTKVTLNQPQELIAYVPYLLGYHPQDSVVAVMARRKRVKFAVRIAMSDLDVAPDLWEEVAASINGIRPDGVCLIAYAPDTIVPKLFDMAAASPVKVFSLLRVEDGRWWCIGCAEPGCASQGLPLRDQPHILAPLIAEGGVAPVQSRADLAACLAPAPATVLEAVAAAITRETSVTTSRADAYAHIVAAHRTRREGPVRLTEDEAARLLYYLRDSLVRDACTPWSDDAAWWLWTDLIPFAPATHIPLVATLLAMCAYQQGRGTMAQLAVDYALSIDPTYQLADLLAMCLHRQVPPTTINTLAREGARHALANINTARSATQSTTPTDR